MVESILAAVMFGGLGLIAVGIAMWGLARVLQKINGNHFDKV